MNKQIFLSLALVALTSFSGAIGEGTGPTDSSTSSSQTEKTEKTVTKELTKDEQKTDASAIRAAYNRVAEFGSAHSYKIGGLVIAGAVFVALYKLCPWFKELIDGTTEAERAPDLQWGAAK